MKNKWFWIIGITVLCCAVAGSLLLWPDAAQERINQTLTELDASDAVQISDEALLQLYADSGIGIKVYESERADLRCLFDGETGLLINVRRTGEPIRSVSGEEPSIMKLTESARTYAEARLGEELIGELQIATDDIYGHIYRFEFKEMQGDVPTGVRTSVICYADGTPLFCAVARDGEFVEDEMELIRAHWIPENEAVELAKEAIRESGHVEESTAKPLGLDSADGKICYNIQFGYEDTDKMHYCKTWVYVDVYSGEIVGMRFCK